MTIALATALEVFHLRARTLGELDSVVECDRLWICTCGAVISPGMEPDPLGGKNR